ncbi:MAG: hypothetical protein FWE74_04035 [Oscillospiraceae bacterium]|nr:hypothetical protein [Oscillospiraceae bacterium]
MKITSKKDVIKNVLIIILSAAVAALLIMQLLGADDDPSSRVINRVQIERRFLIDFDDLPWGKMGTSIDILQSYISFTPEIRLRNVNGIEFTFLLRTPIEESLISRQDVEFELSREEYDELFQKISGTVIHKTRYRFKYDEVDVRIDIFFGDLDGLVFAEVLFDSVEDAEAFKPFPWFGEDVTEDLRYRNAMLSKDGLPA